MKNNDEKIIIVFNNMQYDVHYYPAKFKNKIQLVHGEKNNKFYYGVK